jgi:hypothetical protein
MSLFGKKEESRKSKSNPVEKAALDAEAAKYRMKKQEYQARQGDYAFKIQAQQQAAQPQQPQQPQPIQPTNPAPQPMPDAQLATYERPKPKKKRKLTLGQEMNAFGDRHGGWNKGNEKRWKRNSG